MEEWIPRVASITRSKLRILDPLYFWGYGIPYSYVNRILFLRIVMWAKIRSWIIWGEEGSQKQGHIFMDPYNKDVRMLASIWGLCT